MPRAVEITWAQDHMDWVRVIAKKRHERGGPSKPLDGLDDAMKGDILGVLGEAAVCVGYGYDPYQHVLALKKRPRGDLTDLTLMGAKLGVKTTSRFEDPIHLVVPEYDTACDFYMQCSADTETGLVWIRGVATRDELLKKTPEPWKWRRDRRGYKRPDKLRRYMRLDELHQCYPPFAGRMVQ